MTWDGVRLHIVTGKGGTGKTTVAAALATALAAQGQHVLVAEVEGRQGLCQVFDVPPLGEREVRVARGLDGGQVWGLSVDAKVAFAEYLRMFYKLGLAGSVLDRFGVVDFATTLAPGVRDVLLLGRVYEAVRRRTGRRGAQDQQIYDAVVLDAPPTGRVGKFLNVSEEVAHLAKAGPVKSQADDMMALLRGPATRVHLVTLLEEMPVQETVEAADELRGLGLRLGELFVNAERAPLLRPEALDMLADDSAIAPLEEDLRTAGLRVGPTLVGGLTQGGLDLRDRLALQDEQRSALDALGMPTCHLPLLPAGIEAGGLGTLATVIREEMR
ncbi:ATPase [Calidifontibacter sp. DB0510]|uniref:ATPase n=1 Tax=Metallococcus carri TaxID=1656884 RepID=A0A967B1Z5_9MICO|nr:ArsA-related P-loop ATPase [Metallococcus carri]NHN56828.1 ATPase [Metallococcus carri]NOP37795.1 ATPase [Calidifontibacter sp. DB2511S]